MEDLGIFLISLLIILGAAFVQGATAFGFALVSVPLLLLLLPTIEVVTLSLVLASAANLLMIRDERRAIVWREVMLLLPGAAVGAVGGMLFLKSFEGPWFKAFVAAAFVAMSLLMLAGRSWRLGSGPLLRQVVGLVSGLLMGSTSMGGPPVVLYLTGRGLPRASLRGTLAAFFLLGNVLALAAFLSGGLLDAGLSARSLLLAAALAPGYAAGRRVTARLDSQGFRRLVLVSMALISCFVFSATLIR